MRNRHLSPMTVSSHGPTGKRRRGRPQSLRFLDDPLDDFEVREVFVLRPRVAGEDTIDFGIGLRQHRRILEHFHECERQQA